MNQSRVSVFETRTIKDIHSEIQEIYLSNDFPWVIGYSGGKDSTATVQLVWNALTALEPELRRKNVFIIASDTLVEAPNIAEKIDATLTRMSTVARENGLPFETAKVVPEVSDTFWVNLIGRGYPAPSKRFRWCTERMKIKPANRFILERAAEYGEVVMVLGARKEESMSRAQVIAGGKDGERNLPGFRLKRHSELKRAYVYTPIEDFTVDDVWTYLLQVPSPWGDSNRDLVALYRSAQAGECPLVIDTKTPSCGNSRFGCWVCTVVERDRSMEALVDSGQTWMEPLLEFRNQLSATQEPEKKREYRSFKRRDGRTLFSHGRFIPGPYLPEYRKHLLRQLLELQRQVQIEGPDPDLTLISPAELHEIRRIWRQDFSDWQDSVVQIHREVMGYDLQWIEDTLGRFGSDEYDLLDEICMEHGIPTEMVARLLDVEQQMQGMARRAGIFTRIEQILNEEWRDEKDVLGEAETEQTHREEYGLDTL